MDDFLKDFLPSFDYWLTNLQERPQEEIQRQFARELRVVNRREREADREDRETMQLLLRRLMNRLEE
jgi:hypothetical protein